MSPALDISFVGIDKVFECGALFELILERFRVVGKTSDEEEAWFRDLRQHFQLLVIESWFVDEIQNLLVLGPAGDC